MLAAGCSADLPTPPDPPPFLDRVQTKSEGPVRVSVAALGREESKVQFGVDLAAAGIQPVWLPIDNGLQVPLLLLLSSLDPSSFSPREAAYQVHHPFGSSANQRMDEYFETQAIDGSIPPGGTQSGFVFTNFDEKVKYVNIALLGPRMTLGFDFIVDVPGLRTDYEGVDFDGLYSAEEIVDYQNEAELRAALEQLPCCSTRQDGKGSGDPLNFVIMGMTCPPPWVHSL
jgi:hypothetical protein